MNSRPALAYVGVGSNIRAEENVRRALEVLSENPEVTLSGISTFYRTAPIADPTDSIRLPGQDGQVLDPDFLNGVLELRTFLSSDELLAFFTEVEVALGRERPGKRYAPRTMDLDLLLFGRDENPEALPIWEEIGPEGFLAHTDIEIRPFVAHPLMELAPDLTLPPHGTPLRAFVATFGTPGGRAEDDFTESLRSRFLSA